MHLSYTVLLSRLVPERDYHYTYTYVSALSQLGNGFGSILGWIPGIIAYYTLQPIVDAYRYIIVATSLSRLALLPVLLRIRERVVREKASREGAIEVPWRVIGKFVFVESLIGFGASISIHNIDYYFVLKYGIGSGELGTMYSSIQFFMAFTMFTLPDLAEHVGGPLKLYIVLTSTSIPLLLAITLLNNYLVAAIIYVVRTILMNVASPLFTAFQMRLIPPGYRGRGYAVLSLSWTLPAIPGRGFGGYLLDLDLELPLRLTALVYLVAILSLTILFKNRRDKDVETATL